MKSKTTLLWIIAVLVTICTAYYQRVTGPSYPVKGTTILYNQSISWKLERSHVSSEDYEVSIQVNDPAVSGEIFWKRFNSDDALTTLPMQNIDGFLKGRIPMQPAAGKVMYQVKLTRMGTTVDLTPDPVIMRFRGDVPAGILIPHILCMFIMMLLSTRTGLEFFNSVPRYIVVRMDDNGICHRRGINSWAGHSKICFRGILDGNSIRA